MSTTLRHGRAVAADLDALRASALRREPVTADDMRRRVAICCNAPLPADLGADEALICKVRCSLGLPQNA